MKIKKYKDIKEEMFTSLKEICTAEGPIPAKFKSLEHPILDMGLNLLTIL